MKNLVDKCYYKKISAHILSGGADTANFSQNLKLIEGNKIIYFNCLLSNFTSLYLIM